MSAPFHQKILILSLAFIVACIFQVAFTWMQYGEPTYSGQGVIKGDGRGYYDYLTSIFIDHDLAAQEANGRTIVETKGGAVNKYYCGTALLILPFFLLALAITAIFSTDPISGFELPFQIAMGSAALFYMLLGLLLIYKVFSRFNIGVITQSLIVLMIGVGSNLLFYVSEEITNAHVYSFFTVAAFTFFAIEFFKTPNLNRLLWSSLFFGLSVLIRPVDGLIVFAFPFLAGSKEAFIGGCKFLFSKALYPAISLALILSFVFLQLLLYKLQTGYWVVWSYANEGFYFANPAFFKFLFSFKRGWLVFTPFFLFLLPGVYILYRSNAFSFWAFLLFFIGVVYVLSSWWTWHYGGSFGSRPMIDFYAILVIPVGLFFDAIRRPRNKAAIAAFCGFCVALNFIQSYQVNAQILPSWNLNTDAYLWAFGKLGKEHAHKLGGRSDIMPYHKSTVLLYEGSWDKANDPHWLIHHTHLDGAHKEIIFNDEVEFNGNFIYKFTQAQSDRVFVEYQLERKEFTSNASSEAFIVIDVKDNNQNRKYYDAFRLNDRPDLPLNEWKEWTYKYDIPVPIGQNDQIAIYIWNKGLGSFNVRNPKLKLISLK